MLSRLFGRKDTTNAASQSSSASNTVALKNDTNTPIGKIYTGQTVEVIGKNADDSEYNYTFSSEFRDNRWHHIFNKNYPLPRSEKLFDRLRELYAKNPNDPSKPIQPRVILVLDNEEFAAEISAIANRIIVGKAAIAIEEREAEEKRIKAEKEKEIEEARAHIQELTEMFDDCTEEEIAEDAELQGLQVWLGQLQARVEEYEKNAK